MPKPRTFLALFLITLALASFFWIRSRNSTEWLTPKKGPLTQAIYGLGTLVSEREYQLKPGIAGTLEKVFVREGDTVKSGEPLVKLIEAPAYRAPFSGTVIAVPFQAGENVFPQVPIVTLVDLANQYISMTLEQASALLIRPGQKVKISFESQGDRAFGGVVRSIVPKQGQFSVWVRSESLPEGVLPGMTADCGIVLKEVPEALLLPARALRDGKMRVRDADGKTREITPETGSLQGDWIEWKNPDPKVVSIEVSKR
jgi:macrolide-specific efflux system membrane fusion protein